MRLMPPAERDIDDAAMAQLLQYLARGRQ